MTHEVRHVFTREELRELGERLARAAQDVYTTRESLAEISASMRASIKASEGLVATLARHINQGYEMREVECIASYNTPRAGIKQIYRQDTGELVCEEPMTVADMQAPLAFDDARKPKKTQ